jgi:hypothetical protein
VAIFCSLSPNERFDIVRSLGEECIQEDELRILLERKSSPVVYDGFEPSGKMHIAQVVVIYRPEEPAFSHLHVSCASIIITHRISEF